MNIDDFLTNLSNNDCLLIPCINDFLESDDFLLKKYCNFSGSFGFLFISKTSKTLLVDSRYILQATKQCENCNVKLLSKESIEEVFNKFNTIFGVSSLTKINDDFFKKTNFKTIDLDTGFINKFSEFEKIYDDKIIQIRHFCDQDSCILITDVSLLSNIFGIRSKKPHESRCVFKVGCITMNDSFVGDFNEVVNFINTKKIKNILVDNDKVSVKKRELLNNFSVIEFDFLEIKKLCAIKTDAEIEMIKKAHIYEGVCLLKLRIFMEQNIGKITESDVSKKLEEIRKSFNSYICPSFDTISASAENGSMIHYKPEINNKIIQKDNLYLIDFGGQYLEGTTDTTRVFSFAKKSEKTKKHYTAILKAHIKAATFEYKNNKFYEVDRVCNDVLNQAGFDDCVHSIGHGVGFALNVHQGPFNVSKKCDLAIEDNIVFSIEPGIYIKNEFGIRLESLYFSKNGKFESLTVFPFEKSLIIIEELTSDEIKWLDSYNQFVKKILFSFLNKDEREFFLNMI